jgi:hypothetical protein
LKPVFDTNKNSLKKLNEFATEKEKEKLQQEFVE